MDKKIQAVAMLTAICTVIIGGVLLAVHVVKPVVEDTIENEIIIEQREWKRIYLTPVGDADPGSGASGVLNVTFYKHMTTPAGVYNANLTNNDSSYEWTDVNNTHAGSDLPYGTAFDIVVKVRWNATHAYSSGNTTWMLTWVRGNITNTQLSLTDDLMAEYKIGENSTYMWVHYVWDGVAGGGGAGETITPGLNLTSVQFTFDSYAL